MLPFPPSLPSWSGQASRRLPGPPTCRFSGHRPSTPAATIPLATSKSLQHLWKCSFCLKGGLLWGWESALQAQGQDKGQEEPMSSKVQATPLRGVSWGCAAGSKPHQDSLRGLPFPTDVGADLKQMSTLGTQEGGGGRGVWTCPGGSSPPRQSCAGSAWKRPLLPLSLTLPSCPPMSSGSVPLTLCQMSSSIWKAGSRRAPELGKV